MTFNSEEWVVADFGAVWQSIVTVPIDFQSDLDTIIYILNHTRVKCVVTCDVLKVPI